MATTAPKSAVLELDDSVRWPYLDTAQAARYVCRTTDAVYRLTYAREIPFSRRPNSNKLVFRRDHLDAWLRGSDLKVTELRDGGVIVEPETAV